MDLYCGSVKILVQYIMPIKVEGFYPNSFRWIYKHESFAISFPLYGKVI